MKERTYCTLIIFIGLLISGGCKLNSSNPTSTRSATELNESEIREKIVRSHNNDCDAMIALGDHLFFGVQNSYGAIFWYEKALKCGRVDVAKYLKELYQGLGILNDQELIRLNRAIEKQIEQ